MSEDYDRLRADVLALSKEVFNHGWGGWIDSKFEELLEKHPARETPVERHCSACDPSFSCFLGRAPCSKVPPPTPARATPKVSPMGEIMDAHRLVIARGIRRLSEKHSGISATAMEMVANLVETGDLP